MAVATKLAAATLVVLFGGSLLACDLTARQGHVATAKLMVDPGPNARVQDLVIAEDALVWYAEMAKSRAVTDAVIAQLGLDESRGSLLGRISTTASKDDLLLSIEVRDEDPEAARVLAVALGDETIRRVRDASEQFQDLPEGPERPTLVRYQLRWIEKPTRPERSHPDE